jgi:APA family basic amino acid/polyamine antiporter
MGRVAAGFLGPIGRSLIVAGAIFSMVSASNASILAASGIGSLMGRQGQAPRQFSRIHPKFRTPFWSVMTATALISALIVVFITIFPAHGGPVPVDITLPLPVAGTITITDLGLTTLTGFATLNLLLPLSVVNIALIYSRRRSPDIERGFRVPGVPLIPIIGILANIALITNLPVKGVLVGIVLILTLLAMYLAWGGAPDIDELYEEVVGPEATTAPEMAGESATEPLTKEPSKSIDEYDYRILVPVARPERAVIYAKLAETLGNLQSEDTIIEILTVTEIPDQTPYETVEDTARARARRIQELLGEEDIETDYTVEGHICRDIGFDIVQTARTNESDIILMGYPEEHTDVAEDVEFKAPCGVLFASGFVDPTAVDVVNIGAGGGPHHLDLLDLIEKMGQEGAELHVINVTPEGGTGRPENSEVTVAGLSKAPSVQVHNRRAQTIADGLVEQAAENGGILIIGATRTRRLRRWVFGSTPDTVIDLAKGAGVPVLVYASPRGVQGPVEDYLYPVYRYLKGIRRSPAEATASETEE